MLKRLLICLITVNFLFQSCASEQKLLESSDVAAKEAKAKEYFEECNYEKASPLFKSLIQSYTGTAKVEKMFFYFAHCDYGVKDYLLAAYEFQRLIQRFPRGEYSERAQYMLAMSYYNESPKYFLDQEYTYKALEEFNLFLDRYPNNENAKSANEKVGLLLDKIELKAVEKARLYYQIGDYQSALVAFDDLIIEYPESKFLEEFYFSLVDANYQYADKSIESKKIERFNKVITTGNKYLKQFKAGKNLDKVTSLISDSQENIKKLRYSIPEYYYSRKQYDKAITFWEKNIKAEKNQKNIAISRSRILEASFEKAVNGPTENKLENYQAFINRFKEVETKLGDEAIKSVAKEVESAEKNILRLKTEQGYDLVKEGKYADAILFFKTLVEDKNTKDVEEHYLALWQTQFSLSKKVKADREFELLKEIKKVAQQEEGKWKGSSVDEKVEKLRLKVDKELLNFPSKLVEKRISNGDYKTAIIKAEQILNQDYSKENKEEVVYLLIAASLKNAKQFKLFDWILNFERYERYVLAQKNYNKYVKLVENEGLKVKIEKLKQKIDKGLLKYKNKIEE